MAVTVPSYYTTIDDNEFTSPQPVNEDTMKKLIQNVNMLHYLAPVGRVSLIDTSLPGVSAPIAYQHQLCDGSEIVDSYSPLQSSGGVTRNTPNLNNCYIVGAPNTATNATIGNAVGTINLSHAHTTGNSNQDVGRQLISSGGPTNVYLIPTVHTHTITSDLSAVQPFYEMFHMCIAPYLKIN